MGQRPQNTLVLKIFSALFLTMLTFFSGWAQISVTQASAAITPEQIIETVFLGDGVEVLGINHEGATGSVGFFTDGFADIGIDRGIVMATGLTADINNTSDVFASSDVGGPDTDEDLDLIVTNGVRNVSRYEINFIPAADTLRFTYAFASEEYPEFSCSTFNDIFGFFISGPNPNGGMYDSENIALVPELSDPTGLTFTNLAVSIENVHPDFGNGCAASFDEYYNDNSIGGAHVYDGYLNVFTAQAIVTPCEEYTMKLKIADVGDEIFDSAVFLEAKSFGTGSVDINVATVSLDGAIAEGCNSATLTISIPTPLDDDFLIDAQIIDCDSSATQDVDYIGLPNQFIIPAGEVRVDYEIFAIQDNVVEGPEFICIDIQRDICNRDTVTIRIEETPLNVPFEIPEDLVVCEGDIVNLTSSIPPSIMLPSPPSFSTDEIVVVNPEMTEFTIDMDVDGVFPEFIAPNLIQSVCIDSVDHPLLNDLDFFLITPSGFFLELSTDNGVGTPTGKMINTCFTPNALENINNGNPLAGPFFPANDTYTGDFAIEGVWDDIYGVESLSNGEYSLVFFDDEIGAIGTVAGWSITFQAIYNISTEWSSDIHGSICINCDDIDIEVTENTTFYLEATDSYGCSIVDSLFVEVIGLAPPVENLVCDTLAPQFIGITWDPAPGATGYTLFVPGVVDPAIDIGNVTQWALATGIVPLTEYEITITPLGGQCGGQPTTITCTTPMCLVDPLVIEDISGVSCNGVSDGLLDVVITGNFPPYQYTFQGMTNGNGLFVNLAPSPADGDTLFIEDATGCISSFPITIDEPNPLSINFINKEEITCNSDDNGAVTAQVTGGTSPYDFAWESGSMTNMATDLGPGYESVTITDDNNCVFIDSILFEEPTAITGTFVKNDVTCFGFDNGEAAINPLVELSILFLIMILLGVIH